MVEVEHFQKEKEQKDEKAQKEEKKEQEEKLDVETDWPAWVAYPNTLGEQVLFILYILLVLYLVCKTVCRCGQCTWTFATGWPFGRSDILIRIAELSLLCWKLASLYPHHWTTLISRLAHRPDIRLQLLDRLYRRN